MYYLGTCYRNDNTIHMLVFHGKKVNEYLHAIWLIYIWAS